jgi:hypothetical protein
MNGSVCYRDGKSLAAASNPEEPRASNRIKASGWNVRHRVERAEVQISIKPLPAPADAEAHRRRVREALIAAGLVLPQPEAPSGQPLTEQERDELARRMPPGRPHSEIIIEEREGR